LSEITQEIKEHQDRAVDQLSIGMAFAAKKLKRYYDILVAVGLPEEAIKIELSAYCQGESRLQVEPMIHQIFAQQHQAQESKPDA
jgi:hypothetical protein